MAIPGDIPPMPDFLNDLLDRSEASTPNAKDKAEKDSRWVSEFTDDLTVSIALRQWDKAVTLVEEGELQFVKPRLCTSSPLSRGGQSLDDPDPRF